MEKSQSETPLSGKGIASLRCRRHRETRGRKLLPHFPLGLVYVLLRDGQLEIGKPPRRGDASVVARDWTWLAIPCRTDSTSCLMLLTTGFGKPVKSRIGESGDDVISLAMNQSYRIAARSVKMLNHARRTNPAFSRRWMTAVIEVV